jgi:hypothetical protein
VPPETTEPPTTEPPVEVGTLLEELEKAGNYTTLVAIVEASVPSLPDIFDFPNTFTAVAPIDDAFVDPAFVDSLLADSDAAAEFVLQLIIAGTIPVADLADVEFAEFGNELPVVRDPSGTVTIGGATVVDIDRPASNGIIQGVSTLPVLPT